MRKLQGSGFKLSNSILTIVLLSIIIMICLGLNFVASTTLIDGSYAINNVIAYWIIGEDGWSYDVFKNYFNISLIASVAFTIVYSTLKIYNR